MRPFPGIHCRSVSIFVMGHAPPIRITVWEFDLRVRFKIRSHPIIKNDQTFLPAFRRIRRDRNTAGLLIYQAFSQTYVFSPFSAHNAIWDLYIPGHSPFRF